MANLSSVWAENFKNVAQDVAEQEIVKCIERMREIKQLQAADTKLREARELVKDLNGAYSSAKKTEQAKIDFFLEKLDEIKSGAVNPTSSAK